MFSSREFQDRMRVLAQFHTHTEHEQFFESLHSKYKIKVIRIIYGCPEDSAVARLKWLRFLKVTFTCISMGFKIDENETSNCLKLIKAT